MWLARVRGSEISDFPPTWRLEAKEIAVDPLKMYQKAEKRKHHSLEKELAFFEVRFMRSMPDLLDLNNILNGFRDGRRFQLQTFRELVCDFDNE